MLYQIRWFDIHKQYLDLIEEGEDFSMLVLLPSAIISPMMHGIWPHLPGHIHCAAYVAVINWNSKRPQGLLKIAI